MNPLLRNKNIVGKIIKRPVNIRLMKGNTRKFIPCCHKCICLMYLDLNDFKSQNYYDNCFRTRRK